MRLCVSEPHTSVPAAFSWAIALLPRDGLLHAKCEPVIMPGALHDTPATADL